jgi:hypothetical protein
MPLAKYPRVSQCNPERVTLDAVYSNSGEGLLGRILASYKMGTLRSGRRGAVMGSFLIQD